MTNPVMQTDKIEVEDTAGRRRSARTKGKKVCYSDKVALTSYGDTSPQKKKSILQKKSKPAATAAPIVTESMVKGLFEAATAEESGLTGLELQLEQVDAGNSVEKSAHQKVKDALRAFNSFYLQNVQEEQLRCKLDKAKKIANGEKIRSPHMRPDLKALTKMRVSKKMLYPEKLLGAIPGVDVGHQFFSRAEMCSVGVHSHWLYGIDSMGKKFCQGELSKCKFPLAVAIVLSGQYEDDLDNSEDVVYTGQGGNNLQGNKKQFKDQELLRGNLALKNNMLEGLPVRVIRGHVSKNSYVGKVYTYDGLYKVDTYWAEQGVSGFRVYKFLLKRLEGQPQLTTTQVNNIHNQVPNNIAELRGLVCDDISGGQEVFPIPATNEVDIPPVPPPGFQYHRFIKVADNVKIPARTTGCDCEGGCVDPNICACARLNGKDFPYVHKDDGGRLIEAKAVVYECGPKCKCGPECVNRTSQQGLRYRLEVFRTVWKGWGVRSWDYIPAGAPICEYTGILKNADDVESVLENEFLFDIDCLQTMNGVEGRERRLRDVSIPSEALLENEKVAGTPEYCIDAGLAGNVSRFINHSCEPNLFVQCILSCHQDIKLAKVMLFAADNIPPLQELTYDYGYALNSVVQNGKIVQLACRCGAEGCRKRLY